MSSKYYCTKCQHNHFYSSKIGKKHIEYNKISPSPKIKQETRPIQKSEDDIQEQVSASILVKEELDISVINDEDIQDKRSSNRVIKFIRDYQRSYKTGIEMYGVWWKIFQLSIWSIISIFLVTASIIFIVFLPKIDVINWILR